MADDEVIGALHALDDTLRRHLDVAREREAREGAEQRATQERLWRSMRRAPRQLGLMSFARIPGFAAHFAQQVPDEFVASDAGVLVVSCPCGQAPTVKPNGLTGCACGRYFACDAAGVHAALSPKDTPAATPISPDEVPAPPE